MSATAPDAGTADLPRRASTRGRLLRRYLPPQHGAWAMLVLPYLIGVACSRPVPLHVPLLIAWLGGYLLSYYLLLTVKTRRPGRVAGPLSLYTALTVPAATVVIGFRPQVLWFGPAFALLLGVNALAARRHADRSLVGGLASVVQGCLIVPLAAVVAGVPAPDVAAPGVVVLAYFTGSLLYVKTMIRNHGEQAYLVASVSFHAVVAAAVTVLSWPLVVPFGWLLARSAWLPHRTLTPKQVGLLELVPSIALLVMVPLLLS
jgi:hypothetical protein